MWCLAVDDNGRGTWSAIYGSCGASFASFPRGVAILEGNGKEAAPKQNTVLHTPRALNFHKDFDSRFCDVSAI